MGSTVIVIHFPEPKLIAPLFRGSELQHIKKFFIVGPMTPFDNSILPGASLLTGAMNQVKGFRCPLELGHPFRINGVFHGKDQGVVGPDEKKGGKFSNPRCKT